MPLQILPDPIKMMPGGELLLLEDAVIENEEMKYMSPIRVNVSIRMSMYPHTLIVSFDKPVNFPMEKSYISSGTIIGSSSPCNWSLREFKNEIVAYTGDNIGIETNREVNSVVFHLANYLQYKGDLEGSCEGNEFASIKFDEWTIVLSSLPWEEKGSPESYRALWISHRGQLRKANGDKFTIDSCDDVFNFLDCFFTFTMGFHKPCLFLYGLDHNCQVQSCLIQPSLEVSRGCGRTWFSLQRAQDCFGLANLMHAKWKTQRGKRLIVFCINLLADTNANRSYPEVAIIKCQILLERICWEICVEGKAFTASNFKMVNACTKIEETLKKCCIPIGIPDSMEHLATYAKLIEAGTGPMVITKVRNALVHSTDSKQHILDKLDLQSKWELFDLCQGYVQQMLLYYFDYRGFYVPSHDGDLNRLYDFVPWR